ncbi:MAG: hypothetical protein PHS17_10680 [Desulfobacterales bacterium]|nr:hypothetical protein [Desulfobacterales bacterium]
MEESNLKGGVAASSVTERVWGVPKKRKTTDKRPDGGKYDKDSSAMAKREGAVEEIEPDADPEPEELGYGSDGIRRKRNRQVDVII